MPALPLKLRPASDPLPVVAGWLPTAEVAEWLREARRIVEANANAKVAFYPLAVSPTNHELAGALLLVTEATLALDKIFGPQVQRLGKSSGGVLVPVHSRLEPALTSDEERRLFPWAVHFFHPVLGLTGFDAADGITPLQLLATPQTERMGWFAAVPGPPPHPPLQQLTLAQEISLEEMMADAADDIGSERPDLKPKGKQGGLSDVAGRGLGALGGALGKMGAGILGAFGGGKMARNLSKWSDRMMEEVRDRRKKELNRLLDSFDKNVLDALRHAIPLAGAGSRRGSAPTPGWKLGARNMNVNVGRHGSGPVDQWDIENEMRLKLERKYREAAAQEAAAGNYGRAAYIYGELLGDWNKAAEMLAKGGRPRDAARIYLERLHAGRRAAECLEQAGLLAEAAAMYREQGMHEKAGDLLAVLGQREAAREQWQLALLPMTNPVLQAELLAGKLEDPDRAIFVLDRGWPNSAHAVACFEAEFKLLGRLGRHEEATAVLDRLERSPRARLSPVKSQIHELSKIYSQYPDSVIRDRASELGLNFSGEFLAENPKRTEAQDLLKLVHLFAPEDRLLRRDAERFNLKHNRPDVPLIRRGGSVLRPQTVFPLQRAYDWQSLAIKDGKLMAAGWGKSALNKRPTIVLGTDSIAANEISWPGCPEGPPRVNHLWCGKTNPFMVTHFRNGNTAAWHAPGNPPTTTSALAIGASTDEQEFLVLGHKDTGALMVETYGANGGVRRTRVLDLAPPDIKDQDWFTGGHGEDVWIGGPGVAACVNEKVEFQLAQLNGPVTCFAVAPLVLPSQAIAVANHEVVLLTPQGKGKPLECVNLFAGSGKKPPVACFTRDGRAIIADANGGVVYQLRSDCTKSADIIIPPDTGELICATAHGTNGFALLSETGSVLVFEG